MALSHAQATLIFPHQLFSNHPALTQGRPIYLIEEWLFFRQYRFHKQKLVLHRASMKGFEDRLRARRYQVKYISAQEEKCDIRKLIPYLASTGVKHLHCVEAVDDWLEQRLRSSCSRHGIQLTFYHSPNFLLTRDEGQDALENRKKVSLKNFYIDQRRRLDILLRPGGKPVGGKWSFDDENRSRFPRGGSVPLLNVPKGNQHVEEARRYVEQYFPDNYGTTQAPFAQPEGFYPVTADEADTWLEEFLTQRFPHFGKYQDAIVADEPALFHGVISSMLNIGLLDPRTIVDKALHAAGSHRIPLNSVEGFIRQVIGWREFVRILYERNGRTQRTRNFWRFDKKIPESFWKGQTGIHPLDVVLQKVLATGYCHHIERLMILGNFMLLCEFDPDDVYRWFMEMFVDAYDWVMVPNVYGMSQYADGGIMSTKPYISSSAYITKTSDFPRGAWQEQWDGLFWRFMHAHREFFLQNPRLGMLVRVFDRMPRQRREQHLKIAEGLLETIAGPADASRVARQSSNIF